MNNEDENLGIDWIDTRAPSELVAKFLDRYSQNKPGIVMPELPSTESQHKEQP